MYPASVFECCEVSRNILCVIAPRAVVILSLVYCGVVFLPVAVRTQDRTPIDLGTDFCFWTAMSDHSPDTHAFFVDVMEL